VLCRAALGEQLIDANSFTLIRLASGLITLAIILLVKYHLSDKQRIAIKQKHTTEQAQGWRWFYFQHNQSKGSWLAGTMLFSYAATFSIAYQFLDTGTGALILFASVQLSMMLFALYSGKKYALKAWLGLILAFLGFVYLVLPGVSAPSLQGFLLMTTSGIAWAVYTLLGQRNPAMSKTHQCHEKQDPINNTAFNFFRTIPWLILLLLFMLLMKGEMSAQVSREGILLAVLSGSLASALGYSFWYTALAKIDILQASVLQLSVPVLAAIGGVLFMSEQISMRLLVAGAMIIGGILLVLLTRNSTSDK
jgi:drug/metabolite transporter (DMT)-like permease